MHDAVTKEPLIIKKNKKKNRKKKKNINVLSQKYVKFINDINLSFYILLRVCVLSIYYINLIFSSI